MARPGVPLYLPLYLYAARVLSSHRPDPRCAGGVDESHRFALLQADVLANANIGQ
jgi:hypothetical protein